MEAPQYNRQTKILFSAEGLTTDDNLSSPTVPSVARDNTSPDLSNKSSPSDDSPGGCKVLQTRQLFPDKNKRRKRCCVVCRFEGRSPTINTDYCCNHNVALCRLLQEGDPQPYACPDRNLTCWEKFHQYYLPQNLFSAKGNLRKGCEIYNKMLESRVSNRSENLSRVDALLSAITPLSSEDYPGTPRVTAELGSEDESSPVFSEEVTTPVTAAPLL